jgi:hypothetical protein
MNSLIKFGLGLANVPSELVDEVERQIPGAQRLIAAAKKIEPDLKLLEPTIEKLMPIIQQAFPLFEQLEPLIAEAMAPIGRIIPVIKAEHADFASLLPTAQKVLEFVGKK